MPMPQISAEQRRLALARSAGARRDRKDAFAGISSGKVSATAMLADRDHALQRARVGQLVRAVPGLGPVKAAQLLAELGIDPQRRVSGLGVRQRRALATRLTRSRPQQDR